MIEMGMVIPPEMKFKIQNILLRAWPGFQLKFQPMLYTVPFGATIQYT